MATGAVSPFRPTSTAALNAGTSSASVALTGAGESIVVTNASDALAYVRFGVDPSVSATSSDMPVLANSRVMLCIGNLVGYAAGVLAGGSGNLLFTRGDGSFI